MVENVDVFWKFTTNLPQLYPSTGFILAELLYKAANLQMFLPPKFGQQSAIVSYQQSFVLYASIFYNIQIFILS